MRGGFKVIPVSESYALARALMLAGELTTATSPPPTATEPQLAEGWDRVVPSAPGARHCPTCGASLASGKKKCRRCRRAGK